MASTTLIAGIRDPSGLGSVGFGPIPADSGKVDEPAHPARTVAARTAAAVAEQRRVAVMRAMKARNTPQTMRRGGAPKGAAGSAGTHSGVNVAYIRHGAGRHHGVRVAVFLYRSVVWRGDIDVRGWPWRQARPSDAGVRFQRCTQLEPTLNRSPTCSGG